MGNECTSIAVFILFIGMEFPMVRMINIQHFSGINIQLETKETIRRQLQCGEMELEFADHQGINLDTCSL